MVVVDLYGQSADYDEIMPLCRELAVPVVEDAAEALGATYRQRRAGSLGDVGVLSFNGNKIVTTSGGGALVCDDEALAMRIRHLSTQARVPAPITSTSNSGSTTGSATSWLRSVGRNWSS